MGATNRDPEPTHEQLWERLHKLHPEPRAKDYFTAKEQLEARIQLKREMKRESDTHGNRGQEKNTQELEG